MGKEDPRPPRNRTDILRQLEDNEGPLSELCLPVARLAQSLGDNETAEKALNWKKEISEIEAKLELEVWMSSIISWPPSGLSRAFAKTTDPPERWTRQGRLKEKLREKRDLLYKAVLHLAGKDLIHSPDYRSVKIRGEEFILTSRQASVIEILHTAWKEGTSDLSESYILERLGYESSRRLRDVFKPNDLEAWEKLVTSRRRGTCRLNL